MKKELNEMTIQELEKEAEELKSATEKIADRYLRAFDINTELIKRFKENV